MKKGICKLAPNEVHKGDKIKNTNPECKHYKSKGVITKVSKIKGKKGNVVGNKVEYKASNDGKHWKKGDKLEKTEIQLNKESFKPFRFFFEKFCPKTVGLIEKVYIDGLGNVDAKIDSGNDSNNVLCGVNSEIIEENGEEISAEVLPDSESTPEVEIEIASESIEEAPIVNGKAIVLGLNDKIAFEKNLFAGNGDDLNRVLSQLNTFTNWEEAKSFVLDFVKPDYNNWENKEEFEVRFLEIVENKFK